MLTAAQTHGHTLDLVITGADDPIIQVECTLLSDHFPIACTLDLTVTKQRTSLLNFRKFRQLDKTVFATEITETLALLMQETADIFTVYNEVGERFDQHAPAMMRRTQLHMKSRNI